MKGSVCIDKFCRLVHQIRNKSLTPLLYFTPLNHSIANAYNYRQQDTSSRTAVTVHSVAAEPEFQHR